MQKKLLASALLLAIQASAVAPTFQIPGRIELQAKADASADLYIYGDIGDSWYGDSVTAKDVVDQLNTLDASTTTINVYINSYGGSVTDGLAIHNALKRKAAAGTTIAVSIDGIAASIASLIAMAGSTITMAGNTMLMVHAPWGGLYVTGNAADVRKASAEFADVLDIYAKAMANSYVAKTGNPYDEMLALVTDGADHWYTAAEAKAAGFCDAIVDEPAQEDAATAAQASLTAEPAFARYFAGMPVQIAASLRKEQPVVAPKSPAAAGVIPPATSGNDQGDTMKTEEQKAAEAKAAADKLAAQAAIAGLQARNNEITALANPHMDNADVRTYVDGVLAAADPEITAADVGKQILAIMAKGRTPLNGGGHVVPGADERDKTRAAMASAIDNRTGAAKADGANPFRGFTMFELARACANAAGINTRGMDRMDVVANAFTHSSSDFPLLLGDTARKALKKGYEESPEVFPTFTRAVTLTDFKPTSLAGLGRFSNLDAIPENGEYKYGTFNESGSSLKLITYGKMFGISRQAVINDDLNALSDVPRKMGQAAKRTVGNAVFALLTGNPTLADGFALFSTQHSNLVGSGTVLSTASVDGIRVLMATQKDADGNIVRVPLKYLVVPVGLGGLARTILESQFEVGGNKNLTTPNIVRNSFEVIEDPRLDAASTTAWYGVADPAMFDGIVVGYLDGKQEPYLESKEGWSVDGTQWKVRMDAAAAVADPIALAKNPGA
jgi:ATP-dependent protease ClpP protease subunit